MRSCEKMPSDLVQGVHLRGFLIFGDSAGMPQDCALVSEVILKLFKTVPSMNARNFRRSC